LGLIWNAIHQFLRAWLNAFGDSTRGSNAGCLWTIGQNSAECRTWIDRVAKDIKDILRFSFGYSP